MTAMSEWAMTAGEDPPILEAALSYADRWYVFPAPPGEKKSYKSAKFSNGRNWGATKDPEEIKRDFERRPDANVGIPTGPDNGIFVVEADTPEGHAVDGIASLRSLEAMHGKLPDTLTSESPSGSLHYYFNWPTGTTIRNSTSKIAPGVDVRGDGGMVIAPPSVRPGIGQYRWLNEGTPIADAPDWLIEFATAGDTDEERMPAEPEAPVALVAAALAVIPNADLNWDEWNKIAMAAWRATGGSAEGLAEFARWSKKSKKNVDQETIDRWNHFFDSPPTELGFGTLAHRARDTDPGWRDEFDAGIDAAAAKANREAPSAEDFVAAIGMAGTFAAEPGADGLPQYVIPGTERTTEAVEPQAIEKPKAEEPKAESKVEPKAEPKTTSNDPLILELAKTIWGEPKSYMRTEFRFGDRGSKVVDVRTGSWFDFDDNEGGSLRDLIRKASTSSKPAAGTTAKLRWHGES
jgi:hypothetical protein